MTSIAELLDAPGTEFAVMPDGRRLIDAGMSEWGASRVELHVRCPRLYALRRLMTNRQRGCSIPSTSAPLAKGGLIHVGLAHWYEWMRWRQAGQGDSFTHYFLDPMQALHARYQRLIDFEQVAPAVADHYLQLVIAASRAYVDKYGQMELFKVAGVEQLFTVPVEDMRSVTGDPNCPPFTTRVDIVIENTAGIVYWHDHKSTATTMGADRYTLAGGVLSKEWLGARLYGARWGGVRINMIGWQGAKPKILEDGTSSFDVDAATFKFQRYALPPAPFAVARWPHDYAMHWRRLRAIEVGLVPLTSVANADTRSITLDTSLNPWHYPGADSEQVCETKYGKCEMLELCKMGPPVERPVPEPVE